MRPPMPLELRDPSSGSTFQVPDEGLTIGREGGKADFQVKDNGVSKSHCRIYLDGDAWFLEDLGSANGTYLGEDKLAAPTELMPNDVISMSKTRFEVLGPINDGEGEDDPGPPPTPPPAPKASKAPAKPAPAAAAAKKPAGKPVSAGPAMSAARKSTGSAEASSDGDAGAEAKGIGYFFIAVPKAIAFYLAAIPLLLVNPIGTIRKGISEQKHEPMGKMELIAYALPALFVSAFLPSIATGIALAVRGTFSIMSFIPIVPAISAVIGAVITGYFFHPVMGWIITKLKGSSDERSRTNYFLMLMTATAVLAVPNAIAILLTLAPIPFIGLVGVVLGLVASLAMLFVVYSWFVYFDVMKIVRTIVLVLGALSVVFGLYGGVMAQVAIIRGMGSSSSGGDGAQLAADAQKDAEKLAADATEQAKDAQNAAKEATADAKEATKDAKEAKEAAKDAKAAKPPKEVEKPAEKEVVAAQPPEDKAKPPPEKTTPITGAGYAAFAQMRESIEKRINDDPTVLTRTSGLLDTYKAYENDVYEIETKYQKETAKKPSLTRVNNHLRDAELYEKTEKKVKELYGKLK